MPKLWDKGQQTNSIVDTFTSYEDISNDQRLVAFDIYGSLAHAVGLHEVGIFTAPELAELKKILNGLLAQYEKDTFKLNPLTDEDVHSRIENEVTALSPVLGAKMHTGRSRNDQVLVDVRLYTKNELLQLIKDVTSLANSFLKFAQKYQDQPMPGYTHMQPAMVSSVGLWAEQFTQSLLDDLAMLVVAYDLNDQSPLGSGAAYGVPLNLNRATTQKLLGFKTIQTNSLYCQNSRGKIEGMTLHACTQVMLTLARFAQDVLLFTTKEFNFFLVSDQMTTGSSIMPQKKNLDTMELVRARAKVVQGLEQTIVSIVNGLPSGYNRDLQELKGPLMRGMILTHMSAVMVETLLSSLLPHPDLTQKTATKDLMATYHAYQMLGKTKQPFRQVYKQVGQNIEAVPEYEPLEVIKSETTIGSPGNLTLQATQKNISTYQKKYEQEFTTFNETLEKLTK